LIVYLLKVLPGDKLVIYSFLLLCTQIAIFFIYVTVSRRRFEECQGSIETDNQLIKKMLKYSGWTATGNLSVILSNQGINVIMNIFYGTVVNAAKGLADTITWLVKSFASSILTATVPRMTKLYGEGNIVELNKTIFQSSQLCVFFISVLALPVVLEIDVFMNLWLNEVPQYTTDFIKIVLINSVLAFPTTTLEQGINAIGIVKKSALWLSPVYLSYFPISYAIMYFGGSPITVYYLLYVISIVALSIQLYIINTKIDFPYIKYLIKIPITSIIIFSLSYLISYYIQQQFEPSLFRLLFICALSMLVYCFIYYTIALSKDNKKELVKIIRQKLHIN
jgi:O-antigen/teichoic acid export membrane protein